MLKRGVIRYADNEEDFVRNVLEWCKNDVYVGINPRSSNRGSGSNNSGTDRDVSSISAVVFDLDPIRPAGTASTDAQHAEAIGRAKTLAVEVSGALVDSGSGAHVYLPATPQKIVDLDSCTASLRAFAEPVQKKYTSSTIKVDSTFDVPRIIRCWGTFNNKSSRWCRLLSGTAKRREIDLKPVPVNTGAPAGVGDSVLELRYSLLSKNNAKLVAILSGKGKYISRSECDFAFVAELLRSGFTKAEAAELIKRNRYGKSSDRKPREIAQEIERIYGRIKDTIVIHSSGFDLPAYERDLSTRSPGISTGFPKWDRMTAGLKPSRFYVEAGRPTDGKTTRLVQMAVNIAKQGKSVMYFPTEVPKSALIDKMVSAEAKVGLGHFQYGNFTPEERSRVTRSALEISGLPIMIVEDFSLTLSKIQSAVQSASPDVIIVDFLQYMRYNDPNSNSELSRNVSGIKKIGEDFKIPVILASQLHRKPQGVPDSLSDLKGTGSLEELGDVVTFVRTIDNIPYPAHSRLSILKNKYGEPGDIDLAFYRSICTFVEASDVPVVHDTGT